MSDIVNKTSKIAIAVAAIFGTAIIAKSSFKEARKNRIIEKLGNTFEVQAALIIREALHIDGVNIKSADVHELYSAASEIYKKNAWTNVQDKYFKIFDSQLVQDARTLSTDDYKEFLAIIGGKAYTGSVKTQNKTSEGLPFYVRLGAKPTIRAGAKMYNNGKWELTAKKDFIAGAVTRLTAQKDSKGIIRNWLVIYYNAKKEDYYVRETDTYISGFLGIKLYPRTYGDEGSLSGINSNMVINAKNIG